MSAIAASPTAQISQAQQQAQQQTEISAERAENLAQWLRSLGIDPEEVV